jgi:hypothetical protein
MSKFARGDVVVWRSCPSGCVGSVVASIVVEDGPDVIALFMPDGAACMRRKGRRGGPRGRQLLVGEWEGGHESWSWRSDAVRVHIPGTHHSIVRWWNAGTTSYERWYVNLETDWTRIPIGFDSHDLTLDVEVDDAGSHGWLKDEDELAFAQEHGLISMQDAERARAEAETVLRSIEDRGWLFGADWSRWRPAHGWTRPLLPEGWDAVKAL